MAITLNGTTGITTPTYNGTPSAEYIVPVTAFKNRIINGAMVIDQRNAGSSVTINAASATYTLDRWSAYGQATDGVFTVQRSTTAPSGFVNSLLATVTTADSSIGASQIYISARQKIEGFNVSDLGWGTSAAQAVTLSFWVRSSVTGTFGGAIANSAQNRSYPFTYVVNSANTFEYKTVNISGDTTGTWQTDNGIGVDIFFSIGMGSTYSGSAGAWAAATYYSATGATNLIATNGATFYITGVQLEVGSNATSFDYRPYGTELALCQRYFEAIGRGTVSSLSLQTYGVSGQTVATWYPFSVTKRAAPTLAVVGTFLATNCDQPNLDAATTSGFRRYQVASASAIIVSEANDTGDYFTASAEL